MEHYHFGLIFIFFEAVTNTGFLLGLGAGFILAEWTQSTEIKKKRVVPGHPFAYKSKHFALSTAIGIFLTACVIASQILLYSVQP